MKTLSPDTSPEVEGIMIEGYRKMPAWKKLQQVLELTQLVRQLSMMIFAGGTLLRTITRGSCAWLHVGLAPN
jgi:hypothetical protein